MGRLMVRWALGALSSVPLGFVALGQVQAVVGHLVFGALGGLTLQALRRDGFFAYLVEKR